MQLRKSTLIGLILVLALTVGFRHQLQIRAVQRDVDGLKSARQDIEEQSAAARRELELVRAQIAEERSRIASTIAGVAAARQSLAQTDPSSRWSTPPDNTPDWNPESPYVWIRKDMVPRFSVPMFSKSGQLHPEVAAVLAVDRETLRQLNDQLERVTAEFHELEAARAKPTDQHLPDSGAGTTVTVEVPALTEDGARFESQFEVALNEYLGPQRGALVIRSADSWLDTQFSAAGREPRIISLTHHAQGGWNVSIKSGQSWFSAGVAKDYPNMIQEYIPPHLLPLFKDALNAPAADTSPAQANSR